MISLLLGTTLLVCAIILLSGKNSPHQRRYIYLAATLLGITILTIVSLYVYLAIVMD